MTGGTPDPVTVPGIPDNRMTEEDRVAISARSDSMAAVRTALTSHYGESG